MNASLQSNKTVFGQWKISLDEEEDAVKERDKIKTVPTGRSTQGFNLKQSFT